MMTEPILSALYGTEVKVVTVDGHPVVLTT